MLYVCNPSMHTSVTFSQTPFYTSAGHRVRACTESMLESVSLVVYPGYTCKETRLLFEMHAACFHARG